MKHKVSFILYCPMTDYVTKKKMKKKRAFKRLVELTLQYFGLKEIKETLPVRTEPKILREPYRFWISRASCRMQLLKNQ